MTTSPARKILTGPELKSLSARSDGHGAMRLAVHLLLIGAAGYLVARAGPWTLVPAMALLGILQAALFAPIHETMHMTAFRSRQSKWGRVQKISTSPTRCATCSKCSMVRR